jgi:hypothetical protein
MHKYLCGILYNQYNNTNQHWRQQETDNNNMATMAMAVSVTKQERPTVTIIIMRITQIVVTIIADAVSLSKGRFGSTWFQQDEPSDHGDGNFGPTTGQYAKCWRY